MCDEPTANLDAAGTKQLEQTLRQLKEQGFTWYGLDPVTRIVPNKKAYDRNRAKRLDPAAM